MSVSNYAVRKIMKNSDFIKYMIEDRKNTEKELKESAAVKRVEAVEDQRKVYTESVLDTKTRFNKNYSKYTNFIDDTYKMFMAESFYTVFSESVPAEYKKDKSSEGFMRSMVYDFINENGVYDVLNKMKYKSPYLSNLYNSIIEAAEEIKEENKFDPAQDKEYEISASVIEKFVDDTKDRDEIVNIISKKVADAIEEFVKQNQKDHEKMRKLLRDSGEPFARGVVFFGGIRVCVHGGASVFMVRTGRMESPRLSVRAGRRRRASIVRRRRR